jgi:hypothetical protein
VELDMNKILIIFSLVLLAACGPSQEEKKNIVLNACSIMGETQKSDSLFRIQTIIDAREKIGGETFVRGDDAIIEAIEFGLCQELVLNETYDETLQPLKDAKRERERIAAEKQAEENRIAEEKQAEENRIAEEQRIAAEKRAEEQRIAAEKKSNDAKIATEKRARDKKVAAANAKKKQEKQTIDNWLEVVDGVKNGKSIDGEDIASLIEDTTAKMSNDGRGIMFRDQQMEVMGLLGFQFFVAKLGIPDYILEDISNTAPINGRQEKEYDNIIINWSISRSDLSSPFPTLHISLTLRLKD